MILKRLELSGFKSFARKSVLEFTAPITAIVGPNGSGKSNTAEALRFVLGEQSFKSMRGKRGEDLIFNGTPALPKSNRASVAIIFDNAARALNLDYDEVEIKRVVHRDGVNEYHLNGTAVRLRDIVELLSGMHIGASSHHIISQGEADRILAVSTKERRAMIEDALGLKIYQYKRHESERKLAKTEENIRQVEGLRAEIAPHIRFLEKQVEKVRQSEKMRDDLRSLYRDYFAREDLYLRMSREALERERHGPAAELAALDGEIARATTALAGKERRGAGGKRTADIEAKLEHIRERKDELSRQLGRVEGQALFEDRRIKELSARAKDEGLPIARKTVEQFIKSIDAQLTRVETLATLEELRSAIGTLKRSLIIFSSEQLARPEYMDTESILREKNADLHGIIIEKDRIGQEIAAVADEERTLRAHLETARKSIENEADAERAAEHVLYELRSQKTELVGRIEVIKVKEERLAEEEVLFKRELGEAGILIGRDVLNFSSHMLDEQAARAEPRMMQEDRQRKIERIKIRLEDIGIGGEDVMKEYEEVTSRDAFLAREIADLRATAATLSDIIDELGEKIDTEFRDGVLKINRQFQEYFTLLFGGGTAFLSLVKPVLRRKGREDEDGREEEETLATIAVEEEEQEEGIEIAINLPKKKLRSLAMLSGGERALTSIALLFAISRVNPPPFLVLDETDAALDESNSRKYGDMLETLAHVSQLIIITHNRETMQKAGTIYGVTAASDGASKLLSIHFQQAEALAR